MLSVNLKKLISIVFVILLCASVLSVSFVDANAANSVLFAANDVNKLDNNVPKVVEFPSIVSSRGKISAGKDLIKKIIDANIQTERVSDLLLIATNSFDEAMQTASVSGKAPDFSSFNQRMSEFTTVAQLAFTSHDELAALKIRMDKASKDIKDMNEVNQIYFAAEKEFTDQRYERVMDLISAADSKIIDLTSLGTRAEVIYGAAASNIKSIVMTYWLEISLAIIIPLILFIIFRIQIKRARLKGKIESLEVEKKVLQEEMKKAQHEYFVTGKMAEGVYSTRMNVFGEMVRDLTREIALLKEKEEKINTLKTLDYIAKKRSKKK